MSETIVTGEGTLEGGTSGGNKAETGVWTHVTEIIMVETQAGKMTPEVGLQNTKESKKVLAGVEVEATVDRGAGHQSTIKDA